MKKICQKIDALIQKERLLKKGDKVVLAVSGGADSMVMLHIFETYLKKKYQLRLIVAHLNHKLRGKDSDEDTAFVRNITKQWGVASQTGKRDVKSTMRKGDSLESHARKIRYDFLQNIKAKNNADVIATAHTENDQVETLYIRKTECAGLIGQRGILPKRDDNVIRPMLCITRGEIECYARNNHICYRTDTSNFNIKFLRNKIRYTVLPGLFKNNPQLKKQLLLMGDNARKKWGRIKEKVHKEYGQVIKKTKDGKYFFSLKNPLRYPEHTLGLFLKLLTERPSRVHREALQGLIDKPSGKYIKLPKAVTAWRTPEGILAGKFLMEKNTKRYYCTVNKKIFLAPAELIASSGYIAAPPKTWPPDSAPEIYLDAEVLGKRWWFRNWVAGDYFYPLGLNGKKKVSDFLNQKKVPLPERKKIMIAESPTGIVWVVGHRISDRYKITDRTKKIIKIFLKKRKYNHGGYTGKI